MRFNRILSGPIFRVIGVPATLSIDFFDYAIRAIDKTSGTALASVDTFTVIPAAVVRASELEALGIDTEKLDDAKLTINGKEWRILSRKEMPTPFGTLDGEIYLPLESLGSDPA